MRSPARFIAFLLLLAALVTYIAVKWERFNQETVADDGEVPIISLLDPNEGLETTTPGEEKTVLPPLVETRSADVDYFVEARLQREKARSAQQALLREIIDHPNSSPEIRDQAQQELLQLAQRIAQETELEDLIRAKGFQDVLVYLHDGAAMIIVRSEGLTAEEVARIADIVHRFAAVPLEAMSIVPRSR